MNWYDAVQFVALKLNVIVTPITNNIIDGLQLLLIQILALVKTAPTLYSVVEQFFGYYFKIVQNNHWLVQIYGQ